MQIQVGGFYFAVSIGAPERLGGCEFGRCLEASNTLRTQHLGSEWQPARCTCTPLIARGLFFCRTRYQKSLKKLDFRRPPITSHHALHHLCCNVLLNPLYMCNVHWNEASLRGCADVCQIRIQVPDATLVRTQTKAEGADKATARRQMQGTNAKHPTSSMESERQRESHDCHLASAL